MGLFGSKKNKPIKVMFYEGPLNGFPANFPCQISLQGNEFVITKIKPDLRVTLDKARITGFDIFQEEEFMQRFKGTTPIAASANGVPKIYCVLTFKSQTDESLQSIVFWFTFGEHRQVQILQQEIQSQSTAPASYSI